MYSYLYAKQESKLTVTEKDQLIRLKGIDVSDRIDTRCTIVGKSDETVVDWKELQPATEQTTLSAMDWDKLPATATRVTNYPREEVEACLL